MEIRQTTRTKDSCKINAFAFLLANKSSMVFLSSVHTRILKSNMKASDIIFLQKGLFEIEKGYNASGIKESISVLRFGSIQTGKTPNKVGEDAEFL